MNNKIDLASINGDQLVQIKRKDVFNFFSNWKIQHLCNTSPCSMYYVVTGSLTRGKQRAREVHDISSLDNDCCSKLRVNINTPFFIMVYIEEIMSFCVRFPDCNF